MQPRTNASAIVSLIFGLFGFTPWGIFALPFSFYFGYRAQREIIASDGKQTGLGLAQAGIILSYICLVLGILELLAISALMGRFWFVIPLH